MRMKGLALRLGVLFWGMLMSGEALAQEIVRGVGGDTVRNTGVSGLWVLANISYAGMRAQGHPSLGWRVLAFVFGFPGTLVSFLAVREGSGRAYGIRLGK